MSGCHQYNFHLSHFYVSNCRPSEYLVSKYRDFCFPLFSCLCQLNFDQVLIISTVMHDICDLETRFWIFYQFSPFSLRPLAGRIERHHLPIEGTDVGTGTCIWHQYLPQQQFGVPFPHRRCHLFQDQFAFVIGMVVQYVMHEICLSTFLRVSNPATTKRNLDLPSTGWDVKKS